MASQVADREVVSDMCDVYDALGQPTGEVKRLAEIHRDGDWHETFHCWMINPSQDGGSVLMQRRAMRKRNWPGRIDVAAAGHYTTGEGVADGGLRELAEELGVAAKVEDLIDVGMRVCVDEFEEGTRNHEFQDVRFLIDHRPLNEYNIQLAEVSGLVFVRIADGLALLSGEVESIEVSGFEVQRHGDSFEKVYGAFRLTMEDFIPSMDKYYFKAFILADRIIRGEKYLHI